MPLPHETGFNAADNPYTVSEFLKICEDYGVPNDPMIYRDEKFYWTYQRGIGWPNDYIGLDSMTRWIIEKSQGFTDVGLLRISESLILSSQASARSFIVGNTASALTAQSAFLNNFEDIVNRKVDVREDIKRYQDTLSYASSKVDYSVGEHLYMLPTDMTLKIRLGTVGYNNKIFVSDGKFSLGKNDEVNLAVPAMKSHKSNSLEARKGTSFSAPQVETPAIKNHKTNSIKPTTITTSQGLTQTPAISQKPKTIIHNEEKIALVLALAGGFAI